MPLNKQPLDINFAQGLDQKTDPYQVPAGKFASLVNTIYNKTGQLTKRNGFKQLTALPINDSVTATTLNGNLVAIGSSFLALSQDTNQWINKGPIQPLTLAISPQVRTNTTQLTVDAAIAPNSLSCNVWYDSNTNSYYRICDSATGQVIVDTTQLGADASATFGPKVFSLNQYFVIVYWKTVSAAIKLCYDVISSTNPSNPVSTANAISAGEGITAPFDGYVAPNGSLYISFAASSTQISTVYLTPTLALSSAAVVSSAVPTLISITADTTNEVYLTWWDNTNQNVNLVVYDYILNVYRSQVTIRNYSSAVMLQRISVSATGGILTVFLEQFVQYGYTPATPHTANDQTDVISTIIYNSNTSTAGPLNVMLRSVGLASKAFYLPLTEKTYVLVNYGGLMQPTYFLSDSLGNLVAKLSYGNVAGYSATSNLPGAYVNGNQVQIGYLFADQTTPVNKTTPSSGVVPTGTQIAGLYNQIGINLASFTFLNGSVVTAELGGSLQTTGGFMWQYDGVKPVEQGFHVYPEDLGISSPSTTAGFIIPGTYFYQATYEWTDAQGMIHRSAPSVPVSIVITGTSTNTILVKVPTLRLTYKVSPNPARIVIYRWSSAQQVYYQITSVIAPIANDPTTDSLNFTDTQSDSQILGNTILYTNGGVVEDIAAPALISMTPFNTRLFAIDAEDRNLLWYSKQVIEGTPVEMTDLFTLYVAPTISATGTTGAMAALSAMDDKLIIFKKDAIYYITGTGPDNTGSQNDFSNPTFITSTVGSVNQQSMVFMPNGIMFQSDKGIWLLGRDLSTNYIGAPVSDYNQFTVVAANNIPETNEVRFRLSNGVTLMYDYYYNQWGTHEGIHGISSTIYQGLETAITAAETVVPANQNSYEIPPQVYQETQGLYLDGTNPVLMSLQTGWIAISGIQGFERFYQMLLLGTYVSPFNLNVQFAYDFNPSITQSQIVTPDVAAPNFGLQPGPFGSGSPFGGPARPFKARIFPDRQKCESFQVSIQENYVAQTANEGAALTLSGMQLLAGMKKGTRTSTASRSFG